MKRRNLLGMFAAAGAMGANRRRLADCGCTMQVQRSKAMPPGSDVFKDVGSNLRITNMRVFGVTLDERIAQADRPYVFVKIETNQGVVGWGECSDGRNPHSVAGAARTRRPDSRGRLRSECRSQRARRSRCRSRRHSRRAARAAFR